MKLVPMGDKVVLRREHPEEKTPSGIVLPDVAHDKPQQGRVLSVGDGCQLPDGRRIRPQVTEGDRVLLGRYAGTEVVIDGATLLIVGEDDILAIIP
jgi:chaperonin GroES